MASALAQPAPLDFSEYVQRATRTDRFASSQDQYEKLRFGFFGEVGGLLAAVKKVNRDHLRVTETDVAGEEIGDSLWYLVAAAHTAGISPADLIKACMKDLRSRFSECSKDAVGQLSFRQIDGLLALHGDEFVGKRPLYLGELAKAAGYLVSEAKSDHSATVERFGTLLGLLAIVSASFHLKLEDIATENLKKISERWPGSSRTYQAAFDAGYSEHERFPRQFTISFIERTINKSTYVVQQLSGVFIGDRLTDNSNEPDDYRFHDVFHLAYVAHLGWSPVIRGLLKRKRKSNAIVDENEDGARAMIIEEGIATWIFNHAKVRDFYDDIEPGKLEYGLLKQVHSMVTGYEVDTCPLWQWETAILEGFKVFRELRLPENRGGDVVVDMDAHSISFMPRQQP